MDPLEQLQAGIKQSAEILRILDREAGRLNQVPLTALKGTLGGLLGLAASYAAVLSTDIPQFPLGFFTTSIGLVLGLWLGRSGHRVRLEEDLERQHAEEEALQNRRALIMKSIREAEEAGAPQSVLDDLWRQYTIGGSRRIASSGARALPPPDDFGAPLRSQVPQSRDNLPR